MSTDPLDLVDPLRLLLLLLPERYRAPVGAVITLAIASQALAASIVSRLPLSAREHPRWGRVVRALHWYSLLRMRDEKGTTKPIGDDTGPRVTVAPTRADEVALPRPTAPDAITTLRARTLTGRESFDATARQELAPDVVAAARREGERGSVDVRALVALALLMALLAACPNWQRPGCTTPNSYACIDDLPRWCSTTRELTPIGDEPCARSGQACVIHGDGVASCAPAVDAGVPR